MKKTRYQQKTATLAEVARQAGVSRQTAGRILGDGAQKHKPATVELVRKMADELGYRPNLLAKSVVAGKTNSVGILMPRIERDDFFSRILAGAQSVLAGTQIAPILLYSTAERLEKEEIHRLVDRRVDGIFLMPQENDVDPDYFREITDRRVPVVCVNSKLLNIEPVDFVGTDETRGGKEAAEYLLSLGHRRACSIRWGSPSVNLEARHQGFYQTMIEAGGTCDTVCLPDWDFEPNRQLLSEYLRKANRATAYFCSNDVYAAQLLNTAAGLGLHVPTDLSVIGFADLAMAAYLSPPLSTMAQDGIEIGMLAMNMLLERVDGYAGPAREHLLPAARLQRGSTAPFAGPARIV